MLRNRVECVFSVYIKTNCYHLSCICRLCVNIPALIWKKVVMLSVFSRSLGRGGLLVSWLSDVCVPSAASGPLP